MKFAKELDQDLVPEWRAKYFDYKLGKKKISAVGRALARVNRQSRSPRLLDRPRPNSSNEGSIASQRASIASNRTSVASGVDPLSPGASHGPPPWLRDASQDGSSRDVLDEASAKPRGAATSGSQPALGQKAGSAQSPRTDASSQLKRSDLERQSTHPEGDPKRDVHTQSLESQPLRSLSIPGQASSQDYGSFHRHAPRESGSQAQAAPSNENRQAQHGPHNHADQAQMTAKAGNSKGHDLLPEPRTPVAPRRFSLELPDPALSPGTHSPFRTTSAGMQSLTRNRTRRSASLGDQALIESPSQDPDRPAQGASRHFSLLHPGRTFSMPHNNAHQYQRRIHRLLTFRHGLAPGSSTDMPLESYREVDVRNAEFFDFLDKQLEMIESFYRGKENEASKRLQVLQDQLHEMRDRRVAEVAAAAAANANEQINGHQNGGLGKTISHAAAEAISNTSGRFNLRNPLASLRGTSTEHFGKNTRALTKMEDSPAIHPRTTPGPLRRAQDDWRDFSRRPAPADGVPYRVAKRKLKLAMQEFYRGLELLKSYALMNRTAFRKINKKYDKAVQARPTGRYMAERVNKAHFVQSDLVDSYLVAVEDLYARYFERGNHKVAVNKLRSKLHRSGYGGSIFRNGFLFAAGTVLGVQALVASAGLLASENAQMSLSVSYLLQLYGGYFLALFLFMLFAFDCRIWTNNKINYIFIFEFDTRHNLDWRQLYEIPCFLYCTLAFIMFLNFTLSSTSAMFLYWPVLLISITAFILFVPLKILYYRSREWFAFSCFRLLLAGLFPVEFRDFFLGDMFCSLTYAMGNIEVFFCLYAVHWNNPAQCNSSNSRLLGFFSTFPGIWRALQCLRRYYDTRNIFPHLVNCGKYTCTILFYMTLSLYRIHQRDYLRAVFITFATINSIYVSIWDILMDWSLGNPYAPHPFLRDVLGYKQPWRYYLAMCIDPILRFNWVFYIAFSDELQHSALLSFFVGFSEVLRRGMWTSLRVENEHCTNVGRFRASRDIPLPYDLPSHSQDAIPEESGGNSADASPAMTTDPAMTETSSNARAADGTPATTAVDLETGRGSSTASDPRSILRRRNTSFLTGPGTPSIRGLQRVGTMLATAHAQDFQRKRRPSVASLDPRGLHRQHGGAHDGSSDEGDDSDEQGEDHEHLLARQVSALERDDEHADVVEAERLLERTGSRHDVAPAS